MSSEDDALRFLAEPLSPTAERMLQSFGLSWIVLLRERYANLSKEKGKALVADHDKLDGSVQKEVI